MATEPQRVVVVGAGIVGVTTAHVLRARGHEVTLLESAPAAATGTSQANGGFLSAAFCAPWAMPGLPGQALRALFDREAPMRWRPDGSVAQWRWMRALLAHCTETSFARHRARLVRLALYSRACLRDVVAETGVAFDLSERGVLQLFRQPPSQAQQRMRLAELQRFGIAARWCGPDEVRVLEPSLRESLPPLWALHAQDDASGDCERLAQGLLAWNVERGLRFCPGQQVTALELDAGGQRLRALRTPAHVHEGDAFVMAAGVETTALLHPHLRLPMVPVKGYSVTAEVDEGQGPRLALIDDATKLAVARLGGRVRLAGMAELVGYDRQPVGARCELLMRHYGALFGPRPLAHPRFWAGLRPMTPDGTPLIGATAIQGLYLNTGHGTYGWTLACGSANLLADVMAGRPSALEPAAYSPLPTLRERD